MLKLSRRAVLTTLGAVVATPAAGLSACAAPTSAPVRPTTPGQRLAAAARAQLGVTRGYDPAYRRIAYPGGDVPRATGVCCDVPIRAARDALGLDLQKLVHEDMAKAFTAYPSKRAWGLKGPDANIDHRRVLNLEAFWTRQGARLWEAKGYVLGSTFPHALLPGDMLTWRLAQGEPHVGMVVSGGDAPRIVHNIGAGVEENGLVRMVFARSVGLYRWPARRA
jgi:uncharacterized protein YijF (DUF1287 family)